MRIQVSKSLDAGPWPHEKPRKSSPDKTPLPIRIGHFPTVLKGGRARRWHVSCQGVWLCRPVAGNKSRAGSPRSLAWECFMMFRTQGGDFIANWCGAQTFGPGEKGQIGPTGPPAPARGFALACACRAVDWRRHSLIHARARARFWLSRGPRKLARVHDRIDNIPVYLTWVHLIARLVCVDLIYFILSGVQCSPHSPASPFEYVQLKTKKRCKSYPPCPIA